MFCPKCGTQNEEDSKFCIKCGTALDADWLARPTVAPAPPKIGVKRRRWTTTRVAVLSVVGLAVVACGLFVAWLLTSKGSPVHLRRAQPTVAPIGRTRLKASESYQRFLTQEDYAQLVLIASEFTYPPSRAVVTGTVTAADLLNTPSNYDGKTVTVLGKVIKKTLIYDLLPEDWPRSYLLVVDDETGALPVIYRGYTHDIRPGDEVRVVGGFSRAGKGIHADVVDKADRLTMLMADPSMLTRILVFSSIGVLAFAFFSMWITWSLGRRARRVVASRRGQ